jgi:small subunit ribosomal protein S2
MVVRKAKDSEKVKTVKVQKTKGAKKSVAPSKSSKEKKIQISEKELEKFKVSLTELLEAGCHFGHQVKRWNPKMAPFIYTARDGVHIFDLVKTQEFLTQACLAAKKMAAAGAKIVFVGTKRQATSIVSEEAVKAGMPYVITRWLGGTISNWPQIEKSIKKLNKMKEERQIGEYSKYTKKENILISREIARLEKFLGGLSTLKKIPDALFVIDTNREATAIREARRRGLPIFAIVDSNSDLTQVDFPVPANDDAVRSIKLVVSTFAKAVGEGVELYKKGKE